MIILASQSPRRKQLLHKIYDDFTIIPSHIDEMKYPLDQLSLAKANDISANYPNDLIIAADTLVFLGDEVLGKPQSVNEAKEMLRKLSNKPHEVKTIYSIVNKEKNLSFTRTITSKVYFNKLSEDLISSYVDSGSPLDKAGAYGIQDNDNFHIIDHIEGSYTNIMGLPVDELRQDLIALKLL